MLKFTGLFWLLNRHCRFFIITIEYIFKERFLICNMILTTKILNGGKKFQINLFSAILDSLYICSTYHDLKDLKRGNTNKITSRLYEDA